jgi:hypothetical protein
MYMFTFYALFSCFSHTSGIKINNNIKLCIIGKRNCCLFSFTNDRLVLMIIYYISEQEKNDSCSVY